MDDALAIAEQVDVLNYLGRADPLCPSVYGRVVPILLQKSLCTGDQKFSGL